MSRLGGFLRRIKAAGRDDRTPVSPAEVVTRSRVDQWREFLQRMLAAEGYLVQGSSEEISTGSGVRMWGTDQPFQIIGPASFEDALRQWRVYQIICEEEMDPPPEPSADWHYYKFAGIADRGNEDELRAG